MNEYFTRHIKCSFNCEPKFEIAFTAFTSINEQLNVVFMVALLNHNKLFHCIEKPDFNSNSSE